MRTVYKANAQLCSLVFGKLFHARACLAPQRPHTSVVSPGASEHGRRGLLPACISHASLTLLHGNRRTEDSSIGNHPLCAVQAVFVTPG
ncbi:hypothetical protein RRG08_001058 [Elysia crispata]|uniref:Uncharacterized protein n=1 Tax=Elysia crispata TaxID=231223 RepID=A0AAE1E633_9GAST|nr:hypothetical protein RRG08_001058 [Elysia crispata]